jgi:hypothetical protein
MPDGKAMATPVFTQGRADLEARAERAGSAGSLAASSGCVFAYAPTSGASAVNYPAARVLACMADDRLAERRRPIPGRGGRSGARRDHGPSFAAAAIHGCAKTGLTSWRAR